MKWKGNYCKRKYLVGWFIFVRFGENGKFYVIWRYLVAKFVANASGAIWWPNLQLMQLAPSGGQICKWCHVVAKFNPSYGVNFWVRCAAGNVYLIRSLWKCSLKYNTTFPYKVNFLFAPEIHLIQSTYSTKVQRCHIIRQHMSHVSVMYYSTIYVSYFI